MALITCPKCGKQISDTAEKCIHCGYDLKKSQQAQVELKRFSNLPQWEQKALRNEFYAQHEGYAENEILQKKYEKNEKITNVFRLVCLGGFIIVIIIGVLTVVKNEEASWANAVAVVLLVLAGLLFILTVINYVLNIVYAFRNGKRMRNQMIIDKKFSKWLKEEKHVDFSVVFSSKKGKNREFFNAIDVEKSEIER